MLTSQPCTCISAKFEMEKIQRFSRLFQPLAANQLRSTKNEAIAKSQKLLLDYGFISSCNSTGLFNLLPFGQLVIEKLSNSIADVMRSVGAQRIRLSTLANSKLLHESKRCEQMDRELFECKDRHSKLFYLNATCEEQITDLVRSVPNFSHYNMPLKLYQISEKFRDEKRPKNGLLRSREFLMKDLYTFDSSIEDAELTYEMICESYERFFNSLQLRWIKAENECGSIGGTRSHEFHLLSEIGSDQLKICSNCGYCCHVEFQAADDSANRNAESELKCSKCGLKSHLKFENGIEVGHAFQLGTKYSDVMKCMFVDRNGQKQPVQMNCFGIGLTRLMAAIVEQTACIANNQIQWPLSIAPFRFALITPKRNSHEYEKAMCLFNEFLQEIEPFEMADMIWDDRDQWTIGKRLMLLKSIGIPSAIIFGKESQHKTQPTVELIVSDSKQLFTVADLCEFLRTNRRPLDVQALDSN